MIRNFLFLFVLVYYARGQSLLWKVECEECPGPSYLYGTMHVKDSRAFGFMDIVEPSIEECEMFALEVAMDSISPTSFISVVMLPKGKTLKNYYSKKKYKTLQQKFYEKTGMKLFPFIKMKPLFLQGMIGEKVMDNKEKDFLDLHLYNLAKEKEKKLVGLENIQDQVNALNSIPVKEQAKILYETFVQNDNQEAELMNDLLNKYAQGDLEGVYRLIQKTEYKQEFLKKLFDDRNIKMANRFSEYAKKHTIFGAIGAGHLPGDKGVLELLKNKGFKVTPVLK